MRTGQGIRSWRQGGRQKAARVCLREGSSELGSVPACSEAWSFQSGKPQSRAFHQVDVEGVYGPLTEQVFEPPASATTSSSC